MPRFRIYDPWRALWQIATSNYLLAVALLTLAVALLLAAWLPQTSRGELDRDLAWQAEVQQRFGEFGWFDTLRGLLQTVGVFYVTDAVWYRLGLSLLALALLSRLVDSGERLWRGWRAPTEIDELQTTSGDPEESPLETESSKKTSRWWGEFGAAAVYGGGLLILVGATFVSTWGWQAGPLPVPPGESLSLGHNTGLSFRLDSLAPDGKRGVGELWRDEDTLVSSGEIALGRPLEGDGVGVYLVGNGFALRVEATSIDGQPLDLLTGPRATAQRDAVLMFTEDEPRHLVAAPEVGLVLLLTMREADQSGRTPQIQIFDEDSGELLLGQESFADTNLTVREVSFTLSPMNYASVRAVYDRGAFWVQLGVVGLIAGAAVWVWGPRQGA
jgi:hypothetical protein